MSISTAVRGLVVWFVLMGAEIVHGVARAMWLVPLVGDFHSRQIGVFTGSIINLTIAALLVRWIHPMRVADALSVGMMWLMLTLVFEITFARVVAHASWQRIGSDYDLTHGGLLPIGLLLLALAPLITAKARNII
jgi:hypothetical protein